MAYSIYPEETLKDIIEVLFWKWKKGTFPEKIPFYSGIDFRFRPFISIFDELLNGRKKGRNAFIC